MSPSGKELFFCLFHFICYCIDVNVSELRIISSLVFFRCCKKCFHAQADLLVFLTELYDLCFYFLSYRKNI